MHSDFIVFADESGDHSLTNVSRDYPVFVLSFCIFRKTDYVESVCPLIQRFKLRWWAHDGMVLHAAQIRRHGPPFVFLRSIEKRERFMADLTDTLSRCSFMLVSGVPTSLRRRQLPGRDAGILDRVLRQEIEPDRAANRRSREHAHKAARHQTGEEEPRL